MSSVCVRIKQKAAFTQPERITQKSWLTPGALARSRWQNARVTQLEGEIQVQITKGIYT